MTNNEIRVENAKKKLTKLEAKLGRINIALAGGKNPYMYEERDLKSVVRDIADTKLALSKYEEKVKAENSVEKIEAIEKFLDDWEQKAIQWYTEDYIKLQKYEKEREIKKEIFRRWVIDKFGFNARNIQTKAYEVEQGIDWNSHQEALSRFNALTVKLKGYGNDWEKELKRLVALDKKSKRTNLILRVKKVVGEITDASYLYVADNMEINGIIEGTKGKAKVETITAGGYNIQCYHYRVLVNKLER